MPKNPPWLPGTSEMTRLIREFDWASTPLGPIEHWPQHLKTSVGLMLQSPDPVSVLWGTEALQLYNDAYIAIAQERHPDSLGRATSEVWHYQDALFLKPIFKRVFAGETVAIKDHKVPFPDAGKNGLAERYFSATFLPIYDETGTVAGIFHPVIETTQEVLLERQRQSAEAALREHDERLGRVLDGMAEGFGLLDSDFTILEHNLEALRLDGRSREEIIGKSHWDVYPGSENSELGKLYKRAMAERVPVSLEHCYAFVNGHSRWLEMRAYPTADNTLAVFWRDITDRKQAEAAWRAERDRSAEILESISDAFYAVDSQWRFTYVNRRAEEWWRRCREELLGKVYWEEFPQAIGSEPYNAHLEAAKSRKVIRLQAVSPILHRWVDITIYPTSDGGLSVYFRDISEEQKAEAALRESEARYKELTNALPLVIWQLDPSGLIQNVNERWSELTGRPVSEAIGLPWLFTTLPDDQRRMEMAWQQAHGTASVYEAEFRVVQHDGEIRWFFSRGVPVKAPGGDILRWVGSDTDITDLKRAEERTRFLMREVNHRSKNLLAVVQAIAKQTLTESEPAAFAERFGERLQGLATTQDLLIRDDWKGTSLEQLIRSQLAHFSDLLDKRIKLQGPPLSITPAAAQNLGLALHELATNAGKYGSLSSQTGDLTISWLVISESDTPEFQIEWKESNGPAVSPPRRRGLGSMLTTRITERAFDGKTELKYDPTGVTWKLQAPLDKVIAVLPS